jgi:hypothetical protein
MQNGENIEAIQKRTEIFLPAYHFDGFQLDIKVKDGDYHLDRPSQSLLLNHSNVQPGFKHTVRVTVVGAVPKRRRSSPWYHLSVPDTFALVSLLSILILCVVISDYVVKPLMEEVHKQDSKLVEAKASSPSLFAL